MRRGLGRLPQQRRLADPTRPMDEDTAGAAAGAQRLGNPH
jgi:hypothetical protein